MKTIACFTLEKGILQQTSCSSLLRLQVFQPDFLIFLLTPHLMPTSDQEKQRVTIRNKPVCFSTLSIPLNIDSSAYDSIRSKLVGTNSSSMVSSRLHSLC